MKRQRFEREKSLHEDMEAWRLSMHLITDISNTSNDYSKDKLYGSTDKIRRSSVSSSSNIVDNTVRNGHKGSIKLSYISFDPGAKVETRQVISKYQYDEAICKDLQQKKRVMSRSVGKQKDEN